jgi:DNA polymerase III epsilon subunit-like protein
MAAIGMIFCADDLTVEEEHAFLIKPDGWTFDNDSEAAKVNGLTHERLMDEGVPAAEALRIYGAAIDARRIVVGWNVMHDLKMLRGELRSVGFPDRYMQTRYLCAMQGSRKTVDARTDDGRKKAPKLAEACAFFGIDQGDDGHTGIGDARSTLAILLKLRERGEMPAYVDPYDKGSKK